jgi:hypothetical protein
MTAEEPFNANRLPTTTASTGTYAHWTITGAQGGTFVDLEMGMDPKALSHRVFDAAIGRRYFKRWAEESIDALDRAACAGSEASGAAAGGA